jgi:hypothetical protein
MATEVELTIKITGVPTREGTEKKDTLRQALLACRDMPTHQEYVSIKELATGKVYNREEIARMIKEL